jgi:hypothetical protein
VQKITLTGNVTLSFTNFCGGALQLIIEDDGSGPYTITWPSVLWSPDGIEPNPPGVSETNSYSFTAFGSSATDVYGQLMGLNYS